jgi:hypothetical protein
VLGNRRSQLTLVTADLESFTAYADLANAVIQRRDTICARIRAVRVFGLPGTTVLFLADELVTVKGSKRLNSVNMSLRQSGESDIKRERES